MRCVLLALLVAARGGSFMLEQPGGSMMEYYDKLVWLAGRVPAARTAVVVICRYPVKL